MKKLVVFGTLLCLAVGLSDCTTTKDLERRIKIVAVESSKGGADEAPKKAEAKDETPSEQANAAAVGNGNALQAQSATNGAQAAGRGVEDSSTARSEEDATKPPAIVEKKIYVEKPIYCPAESPRPRQSPGEAVANAASGGVVTPNDYNGAMMLYDYDDALVYQVFAMPLRVTDIYLEPGEKVIEQPFCGDTTRWNIGGGVSKTSGVDTQHLYLKPSEDGLETTLIINTDRRIYHLIIKSFKDTFMFAVTWRYPGTGMPWNFLSQESGHKKAGALGQEERKENATSAFAIDPTVMSTDYTVRYPKANPPQWLPTLVADDGEKTYIVLPETVIHHELPAVFGENGEIVNFRVKDNVFVIDRLMTKIQLKLRNVAVEIRKKGA